MQVKPGQVVNPSVRFSPWAHPVPSCAQQLQNNNNSGTIWPRFLPVPCFLSIFTFENWSLAPAFISTGQGQGGEGNYHDAFRTVESGLDEEQVSFRDKLEGNPSALDVKEGLLAKPRIINCHVVIGILTLNDAVLLSTEIEGKGILAHAIF